MGKLKLKKSKISKLNDFQKSLIKGGDPTDGGNPDMPTTTITEPIRDILTVDNDGCWFGSIW